MNFSIGLIFAIPCFLIALYLFSCMSINHDDVIHPNDDEIIEFDRTCQEFDENMNWLNKEQLP